MKEKLGWITFCLLDGGFEIIVNKGKKKIQTFCTGITP